MKDNQVRTLCIKFYPPTVHFHRDMKGFKRLKSPLQLAFCSNQMQQLITMTAYHTTMNIMIWIHIFPS